MTSLVEKERDAAALREHAAESSTRIETIVEDIRDALGTLPDASPEALAALTSKVGSTAAGLTSVASRLERLEAVHVDQVAAELSDRLTASTRASAQSSPRWAVPRPSGP